MDWTVCIRMDWLILILGVPAVLVPLVLLFGFAGCGPNAAFCTEDRDCPSGTICTADGTCVGVPDPGDPPPPPSLSAPENLTAISHDDHSVLLTWTSDEIGATFLIERALDGDEPQPITIQGTISPTGTTDDNNSAGLPEGVTFVYQVRAQRDGVPDSDPSDTSSATVLPATPANFGATPAGFGIDLSWTNSSTVATQFSLERRVPGGTFTEILPGPGTNTTFSDTGSDIDGLSGGTTYEYHVSAVIDGFEDSSPQVVKSAAAVASTTTLPFTTVFSGTLTTDQPSVEGFCVIQRLSQPFLTGGTQVGLVLRGSTQGDLTLDNIFISQVAATGDPYDAAPDLTLVASGVAIPANTSKTVGPVNYALDPAQDLLIAFDINSTATPGNTQGNLRLGALPAGGGNVFARAATAEAGVPDRTTGYAVNASLFLIEKIEVF